MYENEVSELIKKGFLVHRLQHHETRVRISIVAISMMIIPEQCGTAVHPSILESEESNEKLISKRLVYLNHAGS
jgi:hypothetical protein